MLNRILDTQRYYGKQAAFLRYVFGDSFRKYIARKFSVKPKAIVQIRPLMFIEEDGFTSFNIYIERRRGGNISQNSVSVRFSLSDFQPLEFERH